MASLSVPCISVDKNNIEKLWPHILSTLKESNFLAIDLELSGLGSKDVYSTQMDERYKSLSELVSTRAILSMGLSCYKIHPEKGFFKQKQFSSKSQKAAFEQIHDCLETETGEPAAPVEKEKEEGELDEEEDEEEEKDDDDFHVTATVFDFMCLCSEYITEARSMKFLVQQGFDFNELATNGIPYVRGNDMKFEESSFNMRTLFTKIIALQPTVIFHNGLLDLAFLYQNFYAAMPSKLETWVSDLCEMFPKGIFDTKYISHANLPNSYLEYLFNFSLRKNFYRKIKKQPCISLKFQQFSKELSAYSRTCDLSAKIFELSQEDTKICEHYAKYGWCEQSDMCKNSHNIDLILDDELQSKKGKKNKQLVSTLKQLASVSNSGAKLSGVSNGQTSSPSSTSSSSTSGLAPPPMRKSGSHNSGNDAFMTGYYFLYYLVTNFNKTSYREFKKYYESGLTQFKNKIFLAGKVHPLSIMASNFAKTSAAHREKMQKLLIAGNVFALAKDLKATATATAATATAEEKEKEKKKPQSK